MDKLKCPNCGRENEEGTDICKGCQYDLTALNNNSKHNSKRKIDIDKNADLFTIIIGFVSFGIFLFLSFELLRRPLSSIVDYTAFLGIIIIISLFYQVLLLVFMDVRILLMVKITYLVFC